MKKILSILLSFIILFIFCADAKANVLINEFSTGSSSWVELYNNATISADLSTYKLTDSTTNDKNLSGTISPGGFAWFTFGNWLNSATPDSVKLFDGVSSNPIDEIDYGGKDQVCLPASGKTIGRYPDGANFIDQLLNPTQGLPNTFDASGACPPPTPDPTQSPAPTAAPTAAPTTSPTKSPTPVPTKKPTPWPSATPDPNYKDDTNHQADVLGLRDSLSPTDTPKAQSGGSNGPSFPIIAGIFIVLGLGLMGGAGYIAYKKQKQNSSDTISESR